MAKYDPYSVRRCVRMQDATPDGVVVFASKSFTHADKAQDLYHPMVDLQTGAVFCDCPHFTYRLAKHNPTAQAGEVCKHITRAINNLTRRGLIEG